MRHLLLASLLLAAMSAHAVLKSTGSSTGGGGAVTSVGLSDGSTTPIFSITGTPVTTAGTLIETLNTELANTIFAGPTTGSAAQPTFRALVTADLPAGVGTVSTVSVASTNGFAGTVATAASTPAITLSTSITGPIKGNGTALQAAAAADIYNLFSGTPSSTCYLSGSGACSAPAGTVYTGTAPISVAGTVISVATGTSGALGVLQTDGSTIANAAGVISCATSTSGQLGCVKPDGTTIAATAGTLTVQTLNQNTTGTAAGLSATLVAASGGTGNASYAIGDILYASGSTALSRLADVAAGSYLRSGGVTTAPVWSTVTIPNAAVLGDLWYGSAASAVSALAGSTSASEAVLTQTGNGTISAAPVWSATIPASMLTGGTVSGATAWTFGGVVTAPGLVPNSSAVTNNRINLPATNTIGVATNGAQAVTWNASQVMTMSPAANNYSLQNTTGSITSGTTGFGENWVGTVNDASAVDGIISFANVTCTTCTATSYLVDWQVGGVSEFKVTTSGAVVSAGSVQAGSNLQASAGSQVLWNGRGILTSPAAQQIQFGATNAASPLNQTISTQGSIGGTSSNVAGANLTIQSGLGTGNATGSTFNLQTPHAGSTGTTQQTANTQVAMGDNTVGLPNIATGAGTSYLCSGASNTLTTSTTPCVTGAASQLSIPAGTATFAVGSGVTSVACASGYSCNNTRGTLTIVGGTATTGTIATVSFSATLSAAPACFATMNGGTTFFGIGNSAPTTAAFNITAAVSVIGTTFNVNYECWP